MLTFIYGVLIINAKEEYDAHRGEGAFAQSLKYLLLTMSLILVVGLIAYFVYQQYTISPENINLELMDHGLE